MNRLPRIGRIYFGGLIHQRYRIASNPRLVGSLRFESWLNDGVDYLNWEVAFTIVVRVASHYER